jgi:hypothetical protein
MMSDKYECPRCGYTQEDAELHGDHWRCPEHPTFWDRCREVDAEKQSDALACPTCGTRDDLVVTGIAVLAILGRYQDDNDATWSVTCFGCNGHFRINDAARDEMFGTGWRTKEVEGG